MKVADDEQFAELESPCNDSLPEGWAWAPMGTIAHINPAKPHQAALPPDAPVTFVPMPAVDADSGRIIKPKDRPFRTVRSGYTSFKENDVLFAKITPCMENGKAAVARNLTNGLGFGSTEFHVLRPTGAVIPEYLFYFLRQEWFRRAAEAKMTGSVGQRRVPVEFVENALLPLPPVGDQKRIVTKVEELLTRVNAARQRLARVKVILKRFRQAVLAAACSGRLTAEWRNAQVDLEPASQLVKRVLTNRQQEYLAHCEKSNERRKGPPDLPDNLKLRRVETTALPEIPEEWTWIYLPTLGYMSRGKSKHRPRNAPHLFGGPYPFIQTGNVARSGGRIRSHQQAYSEAGLAQSHLWPAGTVCITIAANIANSAILTYPACFPDSVVGLIPNEKLCLKEYLEFFIRTARASLEQFAPATAQKNINVEILSDTVVPLPPLAEQIEIIRRVEALFKLADSIEKRVAAATARAEKLTQAILAKAFRGELVRTEAELARREGRSYEPASLLLACIRSKQESEEKTKPSRPRVKR